MIYISGHKNPDTDTIVSSLVITDYFEKMGQKAKPVRLGKINKETEFVLKQIKIKSPALVKSLAKKQVFLVDHNEFGQAGDGIEQAEILGVLDHHKLKGDIKTEMPIYFRVEPIGSTASLIFKLFEEKGFALNKKQAFLLLCGIISDTLKLTSPTTTKEDIKIAKILAGISKQKINDLASGMFKAKSDISGMNLKELLVYDYKDFKEKEKNFGIGVCETTMPNSILENKEKILKLLVEIKKEKKKDLLFFGVIDILKKQCHLFIVGEEEKIVVEKAFKIKEKNNLIFLPGVVSRKKQIAPVIIKAL